MFWIRLPFDKFFQHLLAGFGRRREEMGKSKKKRIKFILLKK